MDKDKLLKNSKLVVSEAGKWMEEMGKFADNKDQKDVQVAILKSILMNTLLLNSIFDALAFYVLQKTD